jgi:hypothetical protein
MPGLLLFSNNSLLQLKIVNCGSVPSSVPPCKDDQSTNWVDLLQKGTRSGNGDMTVRMHVYTICKVL